MKTIYLGGTTTKRATITGDVMAIYSPQPVKFDLDAAAYCRVVVTNARTGQSFDEMRQTIQEGTGANARHICAFDVSRMLQIVSDVEGVLERVKYDGTASSIGENITLQLQTSTDGASWVTGATAYIVAIYAACDWGETIGADAEARRLFVNYPQTVRCSYSDDDGAIIITGSGEIYADYSGTGPEAVLEMDLMQLCQNEGDQTYEDEMAGKNTPVDVTLRPIVEKGQGRDELSTKKYKFKDVLTASGRGVYLRWLHRDGSVGYWLFTRSAQNVEAAADRSFSHYLEGVPAAPVSGVIRNSTRQDFSVARTMTVGTAQVSDAEFEYLCGLVSSPVVDMLSGGTRTAPEWVRVNVAPGTYTREYPKSGQNRHKDFELVVVLPERNTIKL